MLVAWISAFVIGAIAARTMGQLWAVECASWIGLMCGLALAFRLPLRVGVALIGVLGFAWGFSHAAPFPSDDEREARVVATSTWDTVAGPLIVRDDAGQIFEATGTQRDGARGRLTALPSSRLVGESRGQFRVTRKEETDEDWLGRSRDNIRQFFLRRMRSLPVFYQRWLAGLMLGESSVLPPDVRDAFKRTGLYHLLVVSGLHVSLMAMLLAAMLRAPAQIAYALRLIRPSRWRHLVSGLDVLAGAAALLYLTVTGNSAAAQRSALLFVIWRGTSVFVGALSTTERLLIAAFFQSALFPIGFVSEGNLMSWAAYLLVLAPVRGGALRVQADLTLLVTAVFGQLALIGLAVNFVMIPAFPFLLVSGLMVMTLPRAPWTPLLLGIHRSFVDVVRLFNGFCDVVPWLSVPPDRVPLAVREACVVVSAWILLNRCRNLTISPHGGEGPPLGIGKEPT